MSGRWLLPAAALLLPLPAAAQVSPTPGIEDPRLQTVLYEPSRPVRLVAFPGSNLTVMLLPGDTIDRVVISDQNAFTVRITAEGDSLNIAPSRRDATASLLVETSGRPYRFDLDTGEGLAAAYLVRFVQPDTPPLLTPSPDQPPNGEAAWAGEYRVSGERVLRPQSIGDDGRRTYIEWAEEQSLPAVFGIGATGEEEAVDGHMRDGRFVIDRVYGELVFRIDGSRARARRLGESAR